MDKKYVPLLPVIAILIAAVSFAGGIFTQKAIGNTSATTTQGQGGAQNGGFGGQGRMGRGTFGTVTAIGSNTITMTDRRSGSAITVNISSSTQYVDSSNASTDLSAIKTGDLIAVEGATGTDGTVTATTIRINPTLGGGAGATPGQSTVN